MSYHGMSLESLAVRTSPPRSTISDEISSQLPSLSATSKGRNTRCSFEATSIEGPSLQESLTTSITDESYFGVETRRLASRWDLWLYFIFYIIIILFGILFLVNINNSRFYQRLNYPNWAPSVWIMMCIWFFTFIISLGGLFILLSHTLAAFFMLMLLMNVVILMITIIILWFAGLIILSCVFLILGLLFSTFVAVMMGKYTVTGACLQIPYLLFLIMLLVILFQLSYDNSTNHIPIGRNIANIIRDKISS